MVRLADVPEPERSVIANLTCPSYSPLPYTQATPAEQRHVALVSTAGLIVRGERPLLPRDPGYRSVDESITDGDILCSHVSVNFDRTGFQQDLNVMLPRDRLVELASSGKIGQAADVHYSFMGATDPQAFESNARILGGKMLALGVNTVVLAPV